MLFDQKMDFLRTLTLIPSNLDWSVMWRSKASYTLALAGPCLAILSPATMQSWQCVSEWGLPIHRQQTTQQARSIGDSSRKSTTRAHKCLHGCSRSNGLARQTLPNITNNAGCSSERVLGADAFPPKFGKAVVGKLPKWEFCNRNIEAWNWLLQTGEIGTDNIIR